VSGSTGLLGVEALSFSWPRRHVFTAWSAEFPAGLTWLRGANGSGKSTLLKLLAGALPPLAGSMELQRADGRRLNAVEQPLDWKREVFWCGPGAVVFDHLTPAEYFGFLASLYAQLDASALNTHTAGFGLAPHLGTPIAALSTGTQRKVWLAAALSVGTRVRLLDEPLNALDAASLGHLHRVLAGAVGDAGVAWIVASHEAPAAGAREVTLASA
jgi:ABC-type multidrug transport system ATPase subunit